MAKYYGKIGFAIQEEIEPSIWKERIIEKSYVGDLMRETGSYQSSSDKVIDDITISNEISIVSDEFANCNIGLMRYVTYRGTRWNVQKVENRYPRLIISVGGVYNGPTPQTAG